MSCILAYMHTRTCISCIILTLPFCTGDNYNMADNTSIQNLQEVIQICPYSKTTTPIFDHMSNFFKFSRKTWNLFEIYGLSAFGTLRTVRIDYAFLHCAAQYWSPGDHVSRFHTSEICPLPEEFAAILGKNYHSTASMAIPSLDLSFPSFMVQLFDLPPSTLLQCSIGNKMILQELLKHGKTKVSGSPSWRRILSFCLYAQFLLISPDKMGDIQIAHIMEQVEEGANPFSVILAETLIGLDSAKEGGKFQESPLLLQIWLKEKLSLIMPPANPLRFKPRQWKSRSLQHPEPVMTGPKWHEFLSTRSDDKIQWHCSWWQLSHVTREFFGHCVPLAGLYFTSFYTPSRLYRQYGLEQHIICVLSNFKLSHLRPHFFWRRFSMTGLAGKLSGISGLIKASRQMTIIKLG